jgi:radical SAM protein with 4Fe4S-binding SPASM domain
MHDSQTQLQLEISDGLPCVTAVTGSRRYRHHVELLTFVMFFLETQGFSPAEVAEIIVQWRGGDGASVLRRATRFRRANRGLLSHFTTQARTPPSVDEIRRMFAAVDKGAMRNPYRIDRDDAPSHVMWLVSDQCQCRCIYCYHGPDIPQRLRSVNKSHLPREKILARIQELHELGCLDITFTGGDPFCRPDMIDILEEAIPWRWPCLTVVTKYPLAREHLHRIRGIGSLIWSLDSLDDACLERLTGARRLATRMLASIQAAVELGISVKINVTATAWNVEGIPALVEELVRLGVGEIVVKNYILPKGTCVTPLSVSPELQSRLHARMAELRDAHAAQAEIGYEHVTQEQHEQALAKAYAEARRRNQPVLFACKSGYSHMTIGLDGVVLLCEQEPEPSFGTVATQSIREIWETNYIEGILRASGRREQCAEECRSCPCFDLCGYRTSCYSRTLTHKGALFGAAEPAPCSLRRVVEQQCN